MRITIVIDDADATAATEAAQTISRAFVRGVSSESPAGGTANPTAAVAPTVDVDVGPAPRFDVSGPSPSGSTSGPDSDPGSVSTGDGSRPATPDRPAGDTAGESVGAAPELGGG